jgi:hypothetical protein
LGLRLCGSYVHLPRQDRADGARFSPGGLRAARPHRRVLADARRARRNPADQSAGRRGLAAIHGRRLAEMPGAKNAPVDDTVVSRCHRDNPGHLPGPGCVTERRIDLGQRRCGGLLELFASQCAAGAIDQIGGRQPARRFQKISTAGVPSSMLESHHLPRELPNYASDTQNVAAKSGILFDATSADRNAAGPKASACHRSLSSCRSPSPPDWTNCRPPLLIVVSIATPAIRTGCKRAYAMRTFFGITPELACYNEAAASDPTPSITCAKACAQDKSFFTPGGRPPAHQGGCRHWEKEAQIKCVRRVANGRSVYGGEQCQSSIRLSVA